MLFLKLANFAKQLHEQSLLIGGRLTQPSLLLVLEGQVAMMKKMERAALFIYFGVVDKVGIQLVHLDSQAPERPEAGLQKLADLDVSQMERGCRPALSGS